MYVIFTYTIHDESTLRDKIKEDIEKCFKDFLSLDPTGLETFWLIKLEYEKDRAELCSCIRVIEKKHSKKFDFFMSPTIAGGKPVCMKLHNLSEIDEELLQLIIS